MELKLKLTAVIEEAAESGYVAYIEEIPGVNTQGETLEETKENLFDALQLSWLNTKSSSLNPYLNLHY